MGRSYGVFQGFSLLLWTVFAALSLAQGVVFTRGQKFQIILLGIPDMTKMPLPPTDAPVWAIDLFDNPASTVKTLKAAGKIVICYFSAGTAEDKREVDTNRISVNPQHHVEAHQDCCRQGL
jgi:hypothetical protein